MRACSDYEAMMAEFSLGVLPGDERADVIAHLERCPSCRSASEVLSGTADELLLTAPADSAPDGFVEEVMAGIGAPRRRRTGRRRAAARLIAAPVAAGLVVAGFVAGSHRAGDDELRTVPLLAVDGARVGDVTTYADPGWYFIRVEHGLPDGAYRCVLLMEDGRGAASGTLFVTTGKGAWGEPVAGALARARVVALVGPGDVTAARASLR